MRKYIVGAVAGFFLATAVTAHAEVINMIGKVVDGAFPVKVNGTTLQNSAIVIEGTSYLPVREFGESLGMDVKFDANLGIELTQKTTTNPTASSNPSATSTIFRGVMAIEHQGQTFFSPKSFMDETYPSATYTRRQPDIFIYDDATKAIKINMLTSNSVTVSVKDTSQVLIYNGTTYVSTNYYPDIDKGLVPTLMWYLDQISSTSGDEQAKIKAEKEKYYPGN